MLRHRLCKCVRAFPALFALRLTVCVCVSEDFIFLIYIARFKTLPRADICMSCCMYLNVFVLHLCHITCDAMRSLRARHEDDLIAVPLGDAYESVNLLRDLSTHAMDPDGVMDAAKAMYCKYSSTVLAKMRTKHWKAQEFISTRHIVERASKIMIKNNNHRHFDKSKEP